MWGAWISGVEVEGLWRLLCFVLCVFERKLFARRQTGRSEEGDPENE